jgi:uncharacterized membrane protein YfcA
MIFDPLTILYGSIVGLSLGLTGGGGSILAIPILVYGLGIPISQAVVISLLMVASIALFGAGRQSLSGNVDWRAALMFSVAGMIISPIVIYAAHDVNETLRLILFAVLMLFVAYKMAFSNKKNIASASTLRIHRPSTIKMAGWRCGSWRIIRVLRCWWRLYHRATTDHDLCHALPQSGQHISCCHFPDFDYGGCGCLPERHFP